VDLTLTPWQRENYERGLRDARTVLEALFFGWLLGMPGGERLYTEELIITPLEGPGGVPDDFVGDGQPDW
jgi:hypothetical protein